MAFFFTLLPTDLQILVFQTWIGFDDESLWNLSALDVACCNHSLRPHFLFLASCVCRGRGVREPHAIAGDEFWNILQWFVSRDVGIKGLCVRGEDVAPDEPITIVPSVEKIYYTPTANYNEMATLCSAFPNLTSLHVEYESLEEEDWEKPFCDQIWQHLASKHGPALQELDFCSIHAELSYLNLVCAALKRMGRGLLKLRFFENGMALMADDESERGDELLETLVAHCSMLQSVNLTVPNGTADNVIEFMLANTDLQEVTLHYLDCTTQDVHDILVATETHLNLKSFQFSTERGDQTWVCRSFERFPSLDSLEVLHCKHIRSKGYLKLPQNLSQEHLQRVFAACSPPIRELCLRLSCSGSPQEHSDCDSEWIGQRVGRNLKVLEINLGDENCDAQLISHCTQLEELRLSNHSDMVLLLVAQTCKQLQAVVVESWETNLTITDRGVQAIFAQCRHLTVVRLRHCAITNNSLQAILDNRLCLKEFRFSSTRVSEMDIDRFESAAKELQLLPVPQVFNNTDWAAAKY